MILGRRGKEFSKKASPKREETTGLSMGRPPWVICAAAINHKGLMRENNEDNFYCNGSYLMPAEFDRNLRLQGKFQDPLQLYAVCDGMGGEAAGERAAYYAVSHLAQMSAGVGEETKAVCGQGTHPTYPPERSARGQDLCARLQLISDGISREAARAGGTSGCTIALLWIIGSSAVAANVGDSRIYRLRGALLEQLSSDHSLVARKVALGLLTKEEARRDPERHVLHQFLGMPEGIRLSPHICCDISICEGDVFLLCSDGLTDLVEDPLIAGVLRAHQDPMEAGEALVALALQRGGRDNVTALVLRAEAAQL